MRDLGKVLAGGVFHQNAVDDELADVRALVHDIGHRSFEAAIGQRRRPQRFDEELWRNLEDTGLARLTSAHGDDAGPAELAVVLYGLARQCAAAPVAETDLLAGWLAGKAGLSVSPDGPLTIALAHGEIRGGRLRVAALEVPWTRAARQVVLAVRVSDGLVVAVVDPAELSIVDAVNLAGEPRDRISVDLAADELCALDVTVYDELNRRGAWARCVQTIGALDSAALMSVAHCRERVQFGQTLSRFQAVQQSLAMIAGEIERGRAMATLAVVAAVDCGFASSQTDFAVTAAKVVLGRVTTAVVTTAHQLHGAIGVSIEYPLWLSTLRAQSWVREFGTTTLNASRLGHLVLGSATPWDFITGPA